MEMAIELHYYGRKGITEVEIMIILSFPFNVHKSQSRLMNK